MEPRIGCFKVGAFEIELARIDDRRLRNWPAAVVARNSAAATLLELSSEAVEEGVRDGMKLWQARQVCPDLKVIFSDTARLSKGNKLVQESLARVAPVFERANAGEFYFDVTASGAISGEPIRTATQLTSELSASGIHGTTGLARNKLVSNVATRCFERKSIYEVRSGEERAFLSPLPVNWLPGVRRLFGPRWMQTRTKMEELCLRLNRDVAAVDTAQLQIVLGRPARVLKQWSIGLDPAPVWGEAVENAAEAFRTFEKDENDDDVLLNCLFRLTERLCSQLRQRNRRLREIKLFLQYADGREIIKTHRFRSPTQLESGLYPEVEKLFFSVNRRVRMRRVGVSGMAVARAVQFELFDSTRDRAVASAVHSFANRHENEVPRRGFQPMH